jgi:two-component system NtrC family sensor kinase
VDDLSNYIVDIDKLMISCNDESTINSSFDDSIKVLKNTHDVEFILSDTSELIKECLFGMEKVKAIIQSLKNFSHAGEDKKEKNNINNCIKEAILIVWNELKYHCEIIQNLGEVPDSYCYPSQLNQVFMNLLINAGHAIKENGKISVSTSFEQGVIFIKVEDNGSGIDEEHLSQLFNPFFTTKPVGQGTGLGLSISYGIIESHGGQIKVESEVGVGTRFLIQLPVIEEDDTSEIQLGVK